jgi:hypothetical protein
VDAAAVVSRMVTHAAPRTLRCSSCSTLRRPSRRPIPRFNRLLKNYRRRGVDCDSLIRRSETTRCAERTSRRVPCSAMSVARLGFRRIIRCG